MKHALLIAGLALLAGSPVLGQHMDMEKMKQPLTRSAAEADTKARFADMDANKDGAVTRDEAAAAHAAMRNRMHEQMFAKIDTNKDGMISRPDDAHHAAMAPHSHPGAAMAPGKMEGRQGASLMPGQQRLFDMADTNKDAKVTQAEALSAALARFDRMDANKDGTISTDERRAGWKGRHKDKADPHAQH